MKIYEARVAPNPRRVRIFLAEKGIDMQYVELDVMGGENLSPALRAKNPSTKVPFLELDDGTCIGESVAICRYFEELQPEPPLFGRTPLEKAQVEMWNRQVEFFFIQPLMFAVQHGAGIFKDRMTPIPVWGEESAKNARAYLDQLDRHLTNNSYLVGDYFSVADISLLCAVDFAKVAKIRLSDEWPHLQLWHQLVSGRPSAQA
ncbi:glutathione S-transferase family protein [Pseudomaricurvus sp. HS19]|uniref:glutathione S-transferase family protein n=1 Tax=Pseudomaricurvus sp. HS19 TaxID=2692626 RepID=UPI001369C295|nr:glutathione S-transferase family protein [Pseudomaricurvus sp. HS19]MYM61933.1 glutathione S-transferase [Pseudomaricurvus sp. HS19]